MKVKVSIKSVERVSVKTNNSYNVCVIDVDCPNCGVGVVIEDFKTSVPFNVEDLECTLEKQDNRWVIVELGYSIPWQYTLGIGLLVAHKCK